MANTRGALERKALLIKEKIEEESSNHRRERSPEEKSQETCSNALEKAIQRYYGGEKNNNYQPGLFQVCRDDRFSRQVKRLANSLSSDPEQCEKTIHERFMNQIERNCPPVETEKPRFQRQEIEKTSKERLASAQATLIAERLTTCRNKFYGETYLPWYESLKFSGTYKNKPGQFQKCDGDKQCEDEVFEAYLSCATNVKKL